jgi:hypothetical protein
LEDGRVEDALSYDVTIRAAMNASSVGLVRVITGAVAAWDGLSSPEVEDVRLAVDEACGFMVTSSRSEAPLEARIVSRDGALVVEVKGDRWLHPSPVYADAISWSLMDALMGAEPARHDSSAVIRLAKHG